MTIARGKAAGQRGKRKLGHVPVSEIPISDLRPSTENSSIYRPITSDDPEIVDLANSIATMGVLEPLVVTRDRHIISGHRRCFAAMMAGLTMVPCRVMPFTKDGDHDAFIRLLRQYNAQRIKSLNEHLNEAVIDADPVEAYQALLDAREERAQVDFETIPIIGTKTRCKISAAKQLFLEAVLEVIGDREDYWPLSDRQIHYALLNDPPLKHASKPVSVYANDGPSYKALVELLTRARLQGLIVMKVIADPTRPVTTWAVHRTPATFLRKEVDGFAKNYWRDLMQSQPNHIEVVGEKNTIAGIIKPVAMRYTIPMTIGRGFCSLRPRYDIVQRFHRSGKDKLVLLILSDHDPDGEEIAHSFARSLRDDFGVDEVEAVKVALTYDQVLDMDLPPAMQAKRGSSNYTKFVERYGTDTYELEALPPAELQQILGDAIDSVLDIEAFNHELRQEQDDAAFLATARQRMQVALRSTLADAEDEA